MGDETMQGHKVILSMLSILLILSAAAGAMAEVKEHREIKGPFTTPIEVTKKCLECHDQEAVDFMKTQHWRWAVRKWSMGKNSP
jgi:hypothetical protein